MSSQNKNERLAQVDYTKWEHPLVQWQTRGHSTAALEHDRPHLMTIFAGVWRVRQLEL